MELTTGKRQTGGIALALLLVVALVFAGRCFQFAEYRRESGSVWLSDNASVKRSNQLIKYDMSGNRAAVGIGAVF